MRRFAPSGGPTLELIVNMSLTCSVAEIFSVEYYELSSALSCNNCQKMSLIIRHC